MTPQEKDLITALLSRLAAQAKAPRDVEAEALIRRGMAEQPDAPYLLVQTVLIQDMALANAESRIAELERQLADAKAATAAAPTSFLGGAARGSVPASGPWSRSPQPAPSAVWGPAAAPMVAPGATSGFLRQAAATAAGVAGGALLFEGIQSLFGPHYGAPLAGMPMQPALSETIINNYYGEQPGGAPDMREAADTIDPGTDDSEDAALTQDQDFGSDDSYDV